MIRSTIHEWLSATFGVVVVEDITQEKVEKAISYDLTGAPINIRIMSDTSMTFEFSMSIQFRCPNGFAGIGWISETLNKTQNRPTGFNMVSSTGTESVEYSSKSEMIISKSVNVNITIERNKVRELIKCVHINGGLNCGECLNE